MKNSIYKCCLCDTITKGYGNNPAPLVNDPKSKCCDQCNGNVISARMQLLCDKSNPNHLTIIRLWEDIHGPYKKD
jgi:hypothetical protein